MLDNIKLTAITNNTQQVHKVLNRGYVTTNLRTGEKFQTGKLHSLNLVVYENKKVEISGSISRYAGKSRIQSTSTIEGLREAFEHLSTTLGVDVSTAIVYSFSIGQNIFLDNPVSEYISLLDSHPSYQRETIGSGQNNSCTYTNLMRVLRFYDLLMKYRAKHIEISELWKDSNILRFEIEYLRPAQEFSKQEFMASTLLEELFWKDISLFFQQEYESIPKVKKLSLPDSYELQGLKDVEQYCSSYALSNKDVLGALLEKLKSPDIAKSQRSRMKAYIKEAQEHRALLVESELITELDFKISKCSEGNGWIV